ncbi:MAG: histidine kinase [Ferruginibacter sp.]
MKKAAAILLTVLGMFKASAQSNIVFQHLNTSNGLSYIGVNGMCADKKGNLWIATGNGLNMFNGKTVEKYFVAEHPELQTNDVGYVTCDERNRIWVITWSGNVTMLDEKRRLHRVGLYEKNEFIKTRWVMHAPNGGVILYTNKGFYQYDKNISLAQGDSITRDQLSFFSVKGFDTIQAQGLRQFFPYDNEHYLFMQDSVFFKVNFVTRQLEKKYSIPNCTALIDWGNNELLVHDRVSYEMKTINLTTNEISYPFRDLKDQFGKPIKAYIYSAEKITATQYLFTTFYEGIYTYDSETKKIINYRHDVADPSSLGNDIQTKITLGKKGWVFLMCNPNGISYFNTNNVISTQSVFTDGHGKGFDGYVAGIATKDNNTYYVGTAQGLLEWKRNINQTTFIDFPGENDGHLFKREEVSAIVIDKKDRIWAGTVSNGIVVIDKNKNLVKHFKKDNKDKKGFKLVEIVNMTIGPDGDVWASGRYGMCKIGTDDLSVNNFENQPLAQFDNCYTERLIFPGRDDLWFAACGAGIYHYNLVTKKLDNYSKKDGLASTFVFDMNYDNQKNIYVGTVDGLTIFYTNGKTKTITKKDGLLIDRAEGLLLDKYGRMWIGNDIGVACYDPKDSSLVTFDERYGLSIYGFRVNSYFQTSNGEFIFGTPHGLQYFQPDSLFNKKITLNALINKIETKSITSNIAATETFDLPASNNQASFYFSSVDFSPHVRTYYEYMLTGIDKDWVKVIDRNSVSYNSLPPGTYTFKVRVSNDNKQWQDAENQVTIIIATPFYKSWWFKLIAVLVGLGLIWIVINYYRQKQKSQRERLETESVINYFASQINSHQQTDTLLWDVAKNCISQLRFEDCVIYLLDDTRNVLVQKAAYGPKNKTAFAIHDPIEIPVGNGITGTVAKTGIAEIVNNTAEDKRYIIDDGKRSSEIAVPIFINKKVVGVIDSEHRQKNFFTQRHLQILSTIAALCANQIQKTKAEEEKQRATIELLQNKQKATESRLQSLRLQMNPHFLFNALNSVQQMILADEEMVATKYLSRFSKLLRAILVHSDKETISLREELEILKLYVELESIRFKESFQYKIECDENIDAEEIKIPTLLVQPFVENAIWHGLMHKEGDRCLLVEFTEQGDFIKCIIEDNGIGRKRSAEMKNIAGQEKKHTSKGIEVSKERLKTLRATDGREGSINIVDITGNDGEAAGTRIEINFPTQN